MVTKNWYAVMKAYRAKQNLNAAAKDFSGIDKTVGYYASNEVVQTLTLCPSGGLSFYTNPSGGNGVFILGRGRTPATVDDYKLEDMITSGLTCSVSISLDGDNDATHKLLLTNTSNEDIIIGEVGIAGMHYMTASNSTRLFALIERTVLDSPLTIPAGGIGTIDYTIKLPIPTA